MGLGEGDCDCTEFERVSIMEDGRDRLCALVYLVLRGCSLELGSWVFCLFLWSSSIERV